MPSLRLSAALSVVLLAAPAAAGDRVGAALENPSGSLGASRGGVLGLLRVELEARGLTVVDLDTGGPPAAEAPGPEAAPGEEAVSATVRADEALAARAGAAGVRRVYVLTVLTLGTRVVLSLAERSGPALDVGRSDRATAASLEEVESVLPRLVQAVLGQVPVAATATVDTVTTRESAVWQRKPGQFL